MNDSFQIEKELEREYVMPTFGRYDVEFVSGKGMRLKDANGKEYLDFLSGIGVCSLGHCHPAVVDAITEQAHALLHVSNYFYIEKRGLVAQAISELLNSSSGSNAQGVDDSLASMPNGAQGEAKENWKSFFANSGAEANECAIKLARLHHNEKIASRKAQDGTSMTTTDSDSIVITLVKSFHGRTLATLAATGQRVFHNGFEPIPRGFLPTPINDGAALEELFDRLGSQICAVMIEPIQGESGIHVCNQAFLETARRLTRENDSLLIFDEVQCGIFRTGKPFAFQNYGVIPDIVTIAKGVGSGIPAAACAAKEQFANLMAPGKHGSTFGGSNIAISAMHATLTELSKPGVTERIAEVGDYLRNKLVSLKSAIEVRGIGLMSGMDLPEHIDAHDVVKEALKRGLVINATGQNTLRFLPPLIATKQDVDEFLEKLESSIEAAKKE